mmetsp:Transcript_34987/g.56295  ORF Transcript_34987/g.56295 Transcript_34987/m.56295 type:complete len:129 (-) Transcript_34987:316-702(-)
MKPTVKRMQKICVDIDMNCIRNNFTNILSYDFHIFHPQNRPYSANPFLEIASGQKPIIGKRRTEEDGRIIISKRKILIKRIMKRKQANSPMTYDAAVKALNSRNKIGDTRPLYLHAEVTLTSTMYIFG